MNFLAHAYLSYNDPGLLTGNMIADAVRGKFEHLYPAPVVKGIHLHRSIDAFTDQHPLVKQTRQIFSPLIRHYALVISDVVYDHFLGSNWEHYHSDSLPTFSQQSYAMLDAYQEHFPLKFARIFPYMKSHDWFGLYASHEGIEETIIRLGHRSKEFIWGAQTVDLLHAHYQEIGSHFSAFFPQLEEHCKEFIQYQRDKG